MTKSKLSQQLVVDNLKIGSHIYSSRLIVGTGKYTSEDIASKAINSSGAELVTLAIKRFSQHDAISNILEVIGDKKVLPNTAGTLNAKEALRSAQLSRELFKTNLIKLEIITSSENLDPNMPETIKAAEMMVKDNFEVYVYCDRDLNNCLKLEDLGCVAIMPLGSSIGSGRGFDDLDDLILLRNKIEQILIVDAGIGVPSEAARVMELGYDAVLVNSAIAYAKEPILMASAFKNGVKSGRKTFLAGRMSRSKNSIASSPTKFLKLSLIHI